MTTPAPQTPVSLVTEVRDKAVIEAKVIASTAATFVVSLVLAVLNDIEDNHALLGTSLPTWSQSVIIAIIPTAITFVSGYLTRHTPRTGTAQQ
jgi:hypothetical protein